ncbi:MAG: hypothetical protein QM489_01770 [Candidatus Izemoplasma sp.]
MKKNLKTILVTLVIIFFYPLGLPLMFITKTFTRKTRWIITLIFVVAIVLGLLALILLSGQPLD